jgi:hypothetical protein
MRLIEEALNKLDKINIKDLIARKDPLSKARKEYKFLVPLKTLPEILAELKEDFFCSTHDEGDFFSYASTYFDTEDLSFFNTHRRSKPNRIKVRIREYKSGVRNAFVECKKKRKGIYSEKDRKKIGENPTINWTREVLGEDCIVGNLECHSLRHEDLEQTMHIEYKRIFLIAKDFTQRVTIDFEINCTGKEDKSAKIIPEYCVFEVKEEGIPKKIMQNLRRKYKIRQQGFSKYCVAMCTLNSEVKKNRWKQTLKHNKISCAK